ncbi:hypothetical protein MJO29_006683 [Puccinia striiformis f. sp. tritici]|nr:hypothetical protein MJO29_006683 [Puccinia striiformis f. sp. tritici]
MVIFFTLRHARDRFCELTRPDFSPPNMSRLLLVTTLVLRFYYRIIAIVSEFGITSSNMVRLSFVSESSDI